MLNWLYVQDLVSPDNWFNRIWHQRYGAKWSKISWRDQSFFISIFHTIVWDIIRRIILFYLSDQRWNEKKICFVNRKKIIKHNIIQIIGSLYISILLRTFVIVAWTAHCERHPCAATHFSLNAFFENIRKITLVLVFDFLNFITFRLDRMDFLWKLFSYIAYRYLVYRVSCWRAYTQNAHECNTQYLFT